MQNLITASGSFSFNSTGEKTKKHKVSVIIPAIIIICNTINASNEKISSNSNYANKVVGSEITMTNKHTYSTQQVRQKDIDDAQAIEDAKIKAVTTRIDDLENHMDKRFDSLYKSMEMKLNRDSILVTIIIPIISWLLSRIM